MIRLVKFSLILMTALIAVGLLSDRSGPRDDTKPAPDRKTGNLVSAITDQFALESVTPDTDAPGMAARSPDVAESQLLAVEGTTPRPETTKTELLPPRSNELIALRTGLKFADPVSVFAAENRIRPPVQEPAATGTPDIGGPLWKVTANRLNVRRGPSANDTAIGAIARGTIVAVIESGLSDWLLIRAAEPALEGYVARRFLVPVDN
ncbi:SH3 domain-containing protein [Defluviimonas aestuarii]|uniref:SH3 domain-containing protein n=1 Tax=Albidovulum aestuarii TaxID=1130726 RepID=UPI002499D7AF|nr:SH3 domain-containing protein [Defluviimonas aestuarii]MDI3338723.1 SH3 domain-containing protein [Defluviimonas aestuarii]